MNVNREFKRVWASCWLDWFIEYGSTPANWTPRENARKAGNNVVHEWIARCMLAMTPKTVRDSWNRSVFAVWWWFMLDRQLFERIMLYVAKPTGQDWKTCWLMYALYARRLAAVSSVLAASVSGRSRKKAECKVDHDKRLAGYAEMERRRRERYEAPLVYESDEDEKTEAQHTEIAQLVEQLEECAVDEGDEDKENQPPTSAAATRDAVREERYQLLQNELSESGSSRVLSKCLTSELWVALTSAGKQ